MGREKQMQPGEQVELNPQPIPPGREGINRAITNPGVSVELNPQPIPPGRSRLGKKLSGQDLLLEGLSRELGQHPRVSAMGGASGVTLHEVLHIHPSLQELARLTKQQVPKPPPPQLPEQLGAWHAAITFSGGVPVGGSSDLTLHQDGSFAFSGHLHVSGAPSYNAAVVWAIKSSDGKLFTFAKNGHLAGTFESGSRDMNWQDNGNNADVAADWAALAHGWQYRWHAGVNMDISSLIDDLKTALQIAGEVIAVVG
jgi:hypothetical protein